MYCKGIDAMLRASRSCITDWNRIKDNIGISDIDIHTADEKFRILGLENFGRYRCSYLKACLEYLGATGDYDQLSIQMKEILGCYACLWNKDSKGKRSGDTYIVYRKNKCDWGIPPKTGIFLYNKQENYIPDKGGIPHKISYLTCIKGKNCYGRTTSLDKAPLLYNSLKGIHLYDWVNEDKVHRLPEMKL